MYSGLCLVKRKKPTDPDVNQQAAFAVEILVFRAGARHNRTSLIRIRNVNIGNSALIAGNSCIDILYIVLDHCF